MENFVRHFVSQRLGRGTVEISLASANEGMVTISSDSESTPFHLFFLLTDVAGHFDDPTTWPDVISRLAISQLHKEMINGQRTAPKDIAQRLVVNAHPWIGDLLCQPYGGATKGFDEMRVTAGVMPGPHGAH